MKFTCLMKKWKYIFNDVNVCRGEEGTVRRINFVESKWYWRGGSSSTRHMYFLSVFHLHENLPSIEYLSIFICPTSIVPLCHSLASLAWQMYNLQSIRISSNLQANLPSIVYLSIIICPTSILPLRHSLASLAWQVHPHSI